MAGASPARPSQGAGAPGAGKTKLPRTSPLPRPSFTRTQQRLSPFSAAHLSPSLVWYRHRHYFQEQLPWVLGYFSTEKWPQATCCCYLTLTLAHGLARSFRVSSLQHP